MYENHGAGALDYFPCRYGTSRVLFRGPKRRLKGRYCAVLGGTETYGRFIEQPYPALLEQDLGRTVVNLGCVNAGPDVFTRDEGLGPVLSGACVNVVQVMGAHNMNNRFYSVHPRRNDRFLSPSAMLESIYRGVDFTEFHFTRHMLGTLKEVSSERFALVEDELKTAWVGRMRQLSERLSGKSVLLWLSDRRPEDDNAAPMPGLGEDPLFVDRSMIDAVRPHFSEYVEVVASPRARAQGVEGMVFSPLDQPAAAQLPGPAIHDEAAEALAPVVARLMG